MIPASPNIISATDEKSDDDPTKPLRLYVQAALKDYLHKLDGEIPCDLHKLVMKEVEEPMFETVMQFTRGNQTRASEILGINRSTLRKKLKQYDIG